MKTAAPELHRLQYVSIARDALDESSVQDIVTWSKTYNAQVGVTGLLLFTGTHFSQFLEGDAAVLDELLSSILRDARHHDVLVVSRAPARNRRFAAWSMKFVSDFGLKGLLEELWWAHQLDAHREARLVQHLDRLLERTTSDA